MELPIVGRSAINSSGNGISAYLMNEQNKFDMRWDASLPEKKQITFAILELKTTGSSSGAYTTENAVIKKKSCRSYCYCSRGKKKKEKERPITSSDAVNW